MSEHTPFAPQLVHMTGIKGSGMVALAQILSARGAEIVGTDTPERFYTDQILADLEIPVIERFHADNVRPDCDVLIYSAAYDPETHPELVRAAELSLPIYTYTQVLGMLSRSSNATAVAGVHGKSSTTALLGTIVKALGLPATTVVGSMVPDFDNKAASVVGEEMLVAETCEYRRHFLDFRPDRILVTSIEADHLDYYRDFDDVLQAFEQFVDLLSENGLLVYCADDRGATRLAEYAADSRPDVRLQPYGESAEGRFRLVSVEARPGETRFSLAGIDRTYSIRLPGIHNALNATGALAILEDILHSHALELDTQRMDTVAAALESFRGLKRRSERVGEADGVVIVDDYAHHPTAIRAEIEALRRFYPDRRLIVDFMSHTYSRTAALLAEFAEALSCADVVFLHKIYASAREQYSGTVSGRTLFEATAALHPAVNYFEEPSEAVDAVCESLHDGDLFVTMGAGDNWQLGRQVLACLQRRHSAAR